LKGRSRAGAARVQRPPGSGDSVAVGVQRRVRVFRCATI
jgi:hypothetical protein